MTLINTYTTFEAMLDNYQTIKKAATGQFKDRGSKFLAYAYPVSNIESVELRLLEIGGLHPKARHLCYAYKIGMDKNQYRINDDGEPSGSAGRPIYNEILSNELTNVLIGVVRYFGGTKLGVSGLINAYKSASQDALGNVELVTKYICQTIKITHNPKDTGRLYDIIKQLGIYDISSDYGMHPSLKIKQRTSKLTHTVKEIYAQYHGYGVDDIPDDFVSSDITVEILTHEPN